MKRLLFLILISSSASYGSELENKIKNLEKALIEMRNDKTPSRQALYFEKQFKQRKKYFDKIKTQAHTLDSECVELRNKIKTAVSKQKLLSAEDKRKLIGHKDYINDINKEIAELISIPVQDVSASVEVLKESIKRTNDSIKALKHPGFKKLNDQLVKTETELEKLTQENLIMLGDIQLQISNPIPLGKRFIVQSYNLTGKTERSFSVESAPYLSDISGLKGIKIQHLKLEGTSVKEISTLKGMPLKYLSLNGSPVSDISSLKGMQLIELDLQNTKVTDLKALQGMFLESLLIPDTVQEIGFLSSMTSLTNINNKTPDAFWKEYDQGNKTPQVEKLELDFEKFRPVVTQLTKDNPGIMKDVYLPGSYDKLKDGRLKYFMETVFTKNQHGLSFSSILHFPETPKLHALKGLKLTSLDLRDKKIKDFNFIVGMPLKELYLTNTEIDDLSLLKGMPLVKLDLTGTKAKDLSPLKGMPLKDLTLDETKVEDLRPLKGMDLESLRISSTAVSDLSPLEGMPLKCLVFNQTEVVDISPLKGMPLSRLVLSDLVTEFEVLRPIKTLGIDFWELHEGDYSKAKRAHSQLEKYLKVLKTNNPQVKDWPRIELSKNSQLEILELKIDGIGITNLSGINKLKLGMLTLYDEPKLVDISPLEGMDLKYLVIADSPISDIRVLKNMKLKGFACSNTKIKDFSVLEGMELEYFGLQDKSINDISFLRAMPLKRLDLNDLKGGDLSIVKNMPLEEISFPMNLKNIETLKSIKTLKKINRGKASDFWKKWKKTTKTR